MPSFNGQPGIFDAEGRPAKLNVQLKTNGQELEVFGTTTSGNQTTCYALTAPDDFISVSISMAHGTGDFVDVVVDGIRRATIINDHPAKKSWTRTLHRVLYQTLSSNSEIIYPARICQMKVLRRDIDNGTTWNAESASVDVGSVSIQIFRKEFFGDDVSKFTVADRAPTFENYSEWQMLNCNVNPEPSIEPFEIGFFHGKGIPKGKDGKGLKERTLQEWPAEYKLWHSFVFRLRSAGDLQRLGFQSISDHHSTPARILLSDHSDSGASKNLSKGDLRDSAVAIPRTKDEDDDMVGLFGDNTATLEENTSKRKPGPAKNSSRKLQTIGGLLNLRDPSLSKYNSKNAALSDLSQFGHAAEDDKESGEVDTSAGDKALCSPCQVKPGLLSISCKTSTRVSLQPQQPGRSSNNLFEDGMISNELDHHQLPQDIPGLELTEHTVTESIEPKDTVPKQEMIESDDHGVQIVASEALVLPGLDCAPAYKASLARAPTQETEACQSISSEDQLSEVVLNDGIPNPVYEPRPDIITPLTTDEEPPCQAQQFELQSRRQNDDARLEPIPGARLKLSYQFRLPDNNAIVPGMFSKACSEPLSDTATEAADPMDIERIIIDSQPSHSSKNFGVKSPILELTTPELELGIKEGRLSTTPMPQTRAIRPEKRKLEDLVNLDIEVFRKTSTLPSTRKSKFTESQSVLLAAIATEDQRIEELQQQIDETMTQKLKEILAERGRTKAELRAKLDAIKSRQ